MGCGAISKQNVAVPHQPVYQILQVFKQTSQTVVYKCKNKLGQLFCYKKYKNIKINEENYPNYLRFKNEAHRLKKLSQTNPDLVRYQNVIIDQDKCLVLIMELIQQKTLKQSLQTSQTPILCENDVQNYCQQIIKTLKFLRQNGSIFCNLKCSNIFLSQDKKGIKLSDFHHIRQFFIEEVPDVIYMAPQTAKSNSYFKQTDIWRLGCIVLQLITNKQPWLAYNHDEKQILQKLAAGVHPSLPKSISKQCNDFLQKCFQILPSMRSNLNDLLNHPFLKKKRTSKKKLQKQNKIQSISKNSISVEILQNSPKKIKIKNKKQNLQTNENTLQILRKSNISINLQEQFPDRSPSANHLNKKKENYLLFQIAKPFKIKKKQTNQQYLKYLTQQNQESPSKIDKIEGVKSKQQILELLQKKQQNRSMFQNQDSELTINKQNSKYKLAKKMSKTSNYRISKSNSKTKIKENQITLNNKKIISTTSKINESISPLYEYGNSSISIINQTSNIESLIRQVAYEESANQAYSQQKYFKKPLRLLKKRLKYLKTAHTQTSIKDDNYTSKNQQKLVSQNHNSQNLLQNQSSLRLMTEQSHQEEIIDTAVSRAQRNRYLVQQQILRQQRQTQRLKWENQLNQQKTNLQDRISLRYKKRQNIVAEEILSNFNTNNFQFSKNKNIYY